MTSPERDERYEEYGEWQREDLVGEILELEDECDSHRAFHAHFVKMHEAKLASLRDAARLVVDAEYRREQWGSDTVATFDRAIQGLRESLK